MAPTETQPKLSRQRRCKFVVNVLCSGCFITKHSLVALQYNFSLITYALEMARTFKNQPTSRPTQAGRRAVKQTGEWASMRKELNIFEIHSLRI